MRPSRWATLAGRHGASRWCSATARSWTLTPVPIVLGASRSARRHCRCGRRRIAGPCPARSGPRARTGPIPGAGRGRGAGRGVRRRRSSLVRGCPGRRRPAAVTRGPGTACRPRRVRRRGGARQIAAICSAAACALPAVSCGRPARRRSSAARRPSPEILSMLSSSGPTARFAHLLGALAQLARRRRAGPRTARR